MRKRQKLWVISELYYPEQTSTGYYMTRIAEGLSVIRDVKVLCGQPNYSGRGTRFPKHETRNGVEIFRVFGTTLDKNRLVFRLLNMAMLGVSILVAAIGRVRRGDHVLVVTTPPNLPLIAAFASLIRGAAYTLLIHDNYPEVLIATGKTGRDSWLVRLIVLTNRWLYKHASRIIVVGRDMHSMLLEKTAGMDIPIITIPNWAELESITPESKSENLLLNELGLTDKFVFLYAGNIGYPNDIKSIIESAARLADRKDIHFIFLGTGVKLRLLEKKIRRLKLENVTLLAPRPRSEQQIFLNACDMAIVSLVSRMYGVSVPSRTYNILAAGKPILGIVESESEVALIIEEEKIGWIVPPSDADALSETILRIADSGDELKAMGKRAREAAESKYSLESALDRYREIL